MNLIFYKKLEDILMSFKVFSIEEYLAVKYSSLGNYGIDWDFEFKQIDNKYFYDIYIIDQTVYEKGFTPCNKIIENGYIISVSK